MKNIKTKYICWTIAAISFGILCLGYLEHKDWILAGLNGLATAVTAVLSMKCKKQYEKLKNKE